MACSVAVLHNETIGWVLHRQEGGITPYCVLHLSHVCVDAATHRGPGGHGCGGGDGAEEPNPIVPHARILGTSKKGNSGSDQGACPVPPVRHPVEASQLW